MSLTCSLRALVTHSCYALLLRTFGHRLGAGRDRFHDVMVAGAAADIAFELVADGLLIELVALAPDDIDRRHDHAGRAIAALQRVVLAERLLHRMQRAVRLGEPFDRGDVGALHLPGKGRAGLHRLAVDMDHAGAALRGVAAHMRAGQPQVLAQELHQQGARVDVTGDGFAVHRHSDGGHRGTSKNPGRAACFACRRWEPATDRGKIATILPRFVVSNKFNSEPDMRGRSRDSMSLCQIRKAPRTPPSPAAPPWQSWRKSRRRSSWRRC